MNILKPLKHGNVLTEEEVLKDIESAPIVDRPIETSRYVCIRERNNYKGALNSLLIYHAACRRSGPLYEHDGKMIIRPPTVKEVIQARVEDYETLTNPDGSKRSLEERTCLIRTSFNTCAGVLFNPHTQKLKLNPLCKELITLNRSCGRRIFYQDFEGEEYYPGGLIGPDRWRIFTEDEQLRQAYWNISNTVDTPKEPVQTPEKYLNNVRVGGTTLTFYPLSKKTTFLQIR